MKRSIYLLDAFALIYRAYFAFGQNPLRNSKGMNVSAIQGFITNLHDLMTKEKPTHIAVAFESKVPTYREIAFPAYKAHRQAMPEELRDSIPWIEQIVEAMNVPILHHDGYEADDVIGTLAKRAEAEGFQVYMVTSDKDYGQLVSENIFVYKPPYLKNPREILGIKEVCEKWDIERVEQVIDLLALMGDTADNIPGIKGVGEKTAVKLLKDYGTVENLLEKAGELSGKMREKIIEGKQDALMSKQLATIVTDVPVEASFEKMTIDPPNREKLTELFRQLEFRTLGKRILGDSYELNPTSGGGSTLGRDLFGNEDKAAQTTTVQGSLSLFDSTSDSAFEANRGADTQESSAPTAGCHIHNTSHSYFLADTPDKQQQLCQQLMAQTLVCFDTETTGTDANQAELVGMSFAWQPYTAYYVPFPADKTAAQDLLNVFRPFFEHEAIAKIGQNIKYDILVLKKYDLNPAGTLHDTMLMHYLLNPDLRHNMNFMAETYLRYTPISIEELIGKKGKNQLGMRQVPIAQVAEYAAEDADVTYRLYDFFAPQIQQSPTLESLYAQTEMPLVRVLADMESEGIAVDVPFLSGYSREVSEQIGKTAEQIYTLAGQSFNLDSPKQLGGVLFEVMKIPYQGKKTATGQYATDEAMLQSLSAEHPIAALLLDYRELSKLRSTYIDALPQLINPQTGRVHTTYNQAVAATGRLSSTGPNLQNIPIRTERGREIRKAFVARNDDYILLSADYSQIELRLMADLSGDENMIAAFLGKQDIHRATAARIHQVGLDEVTSEMRRRAKMVNFGIIYGITAFGLAQRLGISRTESKQIIDEYFKQYPAVKTYMDKAIQQARDTGYCETILGRRRYLKDINSANQTVRGFAERNAINAPIQGSAADMVKAAMITVHRNLETQGLKTKMLLQVHDELVFDVPKNELEVAQNLIREGMIHALPLKRVPIEVEIGIGANWLAAH